MSTQSTYTPPLRVYISYSHQDTAIKDRIVSSLKRVPFPCEVMLDHNLSPGDEWRAVLHKMREEADVFLLLVSGNYLNSKMVPEAELPHILERGDAGTAQVIPVILEKCDWVNQPFARFQGVPKFGQPVDLDTEWESLWLQLEQALSSIALLKGNSEAMERINREKKGKSGVLDLSQCNLNFIPRDLLQMDWLTFLNLSSNQISIVDNLHNLKLLETLILSSNRLTKSPFIGDLPTLETLDLYENQIESMEELGAFPNLRELSIFSNSLSTLNGIEKYTHLRGIDVSFNPLDDVSLLTQLRELKTIDVEGTAMQSLLTLLPHIQAGLQVFNDSNLEGKKEGIYLGSDNNISEPSPEVVAQGRDAILNYFKEIGNRNTQLLTVLKLILVGNSSVGKTNFSEFLRDLPLADNHISTHLLDIQDCDASFLGQGGGQTQLRIFDFGGQDYYHDAHKMYYSHDTAYILLWDNATNKYSEQEELLDNGTDKISYENYPLEYWLESINYNLKDKYSHQYNTEGDNKQAERATISQSSPIFILQNKIDGGEARLDQDILSKKYPNIAGFFNVALKAGKRVNVLKEVVGDFLKSMNLAGRKLIDYEYVVINHYIQNPPDFKVITLDQFDKNCRSIIKNTFPKPPRLRRENTRIIAEILKSIGIMYYERFSEKEEVVFTQVRGLNESIKHIMDMAKAGNDKGIFRTEELSKMPELDLILQLLVKNKSIIPLGNNSYIVPQFLPVKQDPQIDFFLPAFKHNQVRFVYKAYFHKTLLSSLFARYIGNQADGSSLNTNTLAYWRNGMILTEGEGINKQMVFVEFLKEAHCGIINIKTMMPYNRNGLEHQVVRSIEELNAGLTVCKDISPNSSDFFDEQKLKTDAGKKIYEFATESGRRYSINDFKHLTDFDKLPKKLFISYSSKNSDFTKRFITHLEVLKSAGIIDPWYDRMIDPGSKWDDAIKTELKNADMVVLLLSPDLLATKYVMETEIPEAIKIFGNDVSKFFFIELQPCQWQLTSLVNYQQTLDETETGKKIISIGEAGNDKQWKQVVDQLIKKLEDKKR